MTPTERNALHLRISTAIEPIAAIHAMKNSTYEQSIALGFHDVPNGWVSPKEAWEWPSGHGYPDWQPRDWTGDENASAMLVDMMPAAKLYKHPPDHISDEAGWRCRPDWGLDAAIYNVDRKTAIAIAAAEWLEGRKQ